MERETPMRHEQDINERVTRVEAAVEMLSGTMSEVNTSIKHIERSLASMGKTDMKTLMTIAASMISVALVVWGLLIAPINLQIIAMDKEIHGKLSDLKEETAVTDRIVASRATLPGDVMRLESAQSRFQEKIEAIEKREVANAERAKFVESLVQDIGSQKRK